MIGLRVTYHFSLCTPWKGQWERLFLWKSFLPRVIEEVCALSKTYSVSLCNFREVVYIRGWGPASWYLPWICKRNENCIFERNKLYGLYLASSSARRWNDLDGCEPVQPSADGGPSEISSWRLVLIGRSGSLDPGSMLLLPGWNPTNAKTSESQSLS